MNFLIFYEFFQNFSKFKIDLFDLNSLKYFFLHADMADDVAQ